MELKDRRLKAFSHMKNMLMEYYMISKGSEGSVPIAWVSSGAPVEILHAFDIIPIYPENHGALIGATKEAPAVCADAEARGFNVDLCSYARCDFGQIINRGGPIYGLPKPDVLICCNNICGTVTKWYEEVSRIYNVPLLMVDTPFLYREIDKDVVEYVKKQLWEMIEALERITGKKFEYSKLEEVCYLSAEAVELWQQVLDTCRNKPAPMSCFDAFTHLAPIVTFRGQQKCNDYYKLLLSELDERVKTGYGAIPNEKIRLLWDNLPIWFEIGRMSEFFADFGACLVADTYTHAWCTPETKLDPKEGMDGLAKVYTAIHLNIPMQKMVDKFLYFAKRFDVNGIVMHSNRSCKPYSFGQYDEAKILKERYGIPTIIIDGDMTDTRAFSAEQTYTRLEAFLEMLGA